MSAEPEFIALPDEFFCLTHRSRMTEFGWQRFHSDDDCEVVSIGYRTSSVASVEALAEQLPLPEPGSYAADEFDWHIIGHDDWNGQVLFEGHGNSLVEALLAATRTGAPAIIATCLGNQRHPAHNPAAQTSTPAPNTR